MKFCFSDKLYSEGFSDRKLKAVQNQILHGKVKLGVFLITFPLVDEGLLEIYWYPELLQSAYRETEQEVKVVGITKSREDAFSLVERIVKDIGVVDGKVYVHEYFEPD